MTRGLLLAFLGLGILVGAVVYGLMPDTVSTRHAVALGVAVAGAVMGGAGARYRESVDS